MTVLDAGGRALVARMLAGDQDAFEEFFAASFPPLFRFAADRLADASAAEEVVQAALSRAVRKLHTYRGEAALFTWLCTFCRHEIAAWYERRARRPREVELVEDLPDVRAALESLSPDVLASPEAELHRRELRRLVQATLDALPGRYGDALEWKYIEGRSVEEIGDRLGIGHTAAQSLLARARVAFKDGMEAVFGATAGDVMTRFGA
jgi:RNA polymerase sigma-70 factor (ECF subfamily)